VYGAWSDRRRIRPEKDRAIAAKPEPVRIAPRI